MQLHPSPQPFATWPDLLTGAASLLLGDKVHWGSGAKHNSDAHHTQKKTNRDSRELSPAGRQPLSSDQWQISALVPLARICSSVG